MLEELEVQQCFVPTVRFALAPMSSALQFPMKELIARQPGCGGAKSSGMPCQAGACSVVHRTWYFVSALHVRVQLFSLHAKARIKP